MTMFATFVAFVSGVMVLTEALNRLFKVERSGVKLAMSWIVPVVLAVVGFVLQLGFFADCGSIDAWQGWVKAVLIGFGGGLCANGLYNREEMWTFLQWLFGAFGKDRQNGSNGLNRRS